MRVADAYGWLMERAGPADPFDLHVVASILALAWAEALAGRGSLPFCAGLDGVALEGLALRLFPGAWPGIAVLAGSPASLGPANLGDDELAVRDLLWMYAGGGTDLQRDLAAMIARRCSRPNHLWQDLGLRDRGELSALMRRHFGALADRNRQDMKWKKFLFRMICRAEGFTLCTAPVCTDCDDFDACFGAEDGEAMLAHIRSGRPLPVY
ncbi:nitrogen fixation protein NifQ [Nitrospirillum viridazoti Y2]|uniref:Nitrogen fixation protein NifQ n=1 Tax=Nitrospirillum amazonense TaxID=28077 RepID=A0A560I291_9PROT|nr:nitrogen fixation protein NifQ [Nitrospirillum amazonense]EGX99777.1 nitrogen fixation protein NifQ [Nitrospirillum amazonense Y2]TWB53023.1 nitrogen fixation protein NifQ [Nitrospirillum amazonense]